MQIWWFFAIYDASAPPRNDIICLKRNPAMDRFKKFISSAKRRSAVKSSVATPAPKQFTDADREKFAKAVVRDYGETLVMLGKE